jgi:hypothetical protein
MPHTDYMLALTPRTNQTSIFGEARASVVSLVPNPAVQPARLYALLVSGGGVIHREDVATALQQAGFTVAPFTPTAEELAYLVKQHEAFSTAPKLWSVACDQPIYVTEEGARRCGPPPGLQRVPEEDAITTGLLTQDDLQAPLRHVDPRAVRGYAVYGVPPGTLPTPAMVERAIDTVRRLENIRARVDRLQVMQRQSGLAVLPTVEGRVARCARVLATFAQPVDVLRKGYTPLRRKLRRMKAPGAELLPVDPFPRFGEPVTLSAGTIAAIALVAVIVVSAAAAVIYLAYSWQQVVAAQAELDLAEAEQRQQLLECITDPSATPMQRLSCSHALHELSVQSQERTERGQDSNPFAALADAMKYAVPLAAIGFIAVYFGPVLRQGVQAAAQGIGAARQRPRQITMRE